jgi:glyoxylase-like metal-dependent hydrolase (beta-lactamase superfamily II)
MHEANIESLRRERPALEYPCGDGPAAGAALRVAPGVFWIRMPMPVAIGHINLWAIEDIDGWAIVDTGLHTSETMAAWRALFSGPLSGGASRVLVTHMHPDHVGMAGWLTREFGCQLWMTRLEYLTCRSLVADTGRAAPQDGLSFYVRAGWGAEAMERYRARFGNFGKMMYPLPDSFRRLQDGETIAIGRHQWTVVVGNGHSPEHACLYCPQLKLLVSGDQVLPKISSNISVFPTEPQANPLADWIGSLQKIKHAVPDDVLVLPAHGEPFRGLHARLDYLAASQDDALARLRTVLEQPKRAVDVFAALFSRDILSEDEGRFGLATGESVAHLNYLIARNEAVAGPDGDGVLWFRRSSVAHDNPAEPGIDSLEAMPIHESKQ